MEWACRVVYGIDLHAEVYVCCDLSVVWGDQFKIDPNADEMSASIAALAQMMKFHLGGASFGELRRDLIGSGVGEQFANRVYDHLKDVLVAEWDALRVRVDWYDVDTASAGVAETTVQGESS